MKAHAQLAVIVASALFVVGCKKTQSPAPAPTAAEAASVTTPARPADPYAGWVTWDHPEGLFTVKFPKQYKVQEIEGGGSRKVQQAYLMAMPNLLFAQGQAYELTEDQRFDPVKAIAGARDQMLASMEGTLVSEREIDQEGVEGIEIAYQGNMEGEPVWGKARIYASASPAASYMANAMRLTAEENPQADAFLASMDIGRSGTSTTKMAGQAP